MIIIKNNNKIIIIDILTGIDFTQITYTQAARG